MNANDTWYDTPLPLKTLARYLPKKPRPLTIRRWIQGGLLRRDLVIVKLEAFGTPLQSTLENYWRMQLRLDPGTIALLQRHADGKELCLSMCGACERYCKFEVERLQIRDEALAALGWRRWDNHTWICKGCVG